MEFFIYYACSTFLKKEQIQMHLSGIDKRKCVKLNFQDVNIM